MVIAAARCLLRSTALRRATARMAFQAKPAPFGNPSRTPVIARRIFRSPFESFYCLESMQRYRAVNTQAGCPPPQDSSQGLGALSETVVGLSETGNTVDSVADTCENVQESASVEEDDKPSPLIPVRALFLGTRIDLVGLIEDLKNMVLPSPSELASYVIIQLSSDMENCDADTKETDCRYAVVFQYGAVILFDVPDSQIDGFLMTVDKHTSGSLAEMRKKDFDVGDKIDITPSGISSIGSVFGQSIALDYYGHEIDKAVANFKDINKRDFAQNERFGEASANLSSILLEFALVKRSDIFETDEKHDQIADCLRKKLKLTRRFASLDDELKTVKIHHNMIHTRATLENKKSVILEWTLICLLVVDIFVEVTDIKWAKLMAMAKDIFV